MHTDKLQYPDSCFKCVTVPNEVRTPFEATGVLLSAVLTDGAWTSVLLKERFQIKGEVGKKLLLFG